MTSTEIHTHDVPVLDYRWAPPDCPVGESWKKLDEIRREHDVFRSEDGQAGYWVFTRAAVILELLQHPELFSNKTVMPTIPNPPFKWIPIMLDPPMHGKWRQILADWFTPGRVSSMDEAVRQRCRDLVLGLKDKGGCDLVADFTTQFPTSVFLGILGAPIEHLPMFMEWEELIAHASIETDPDHAKMIKAMGEVQQYFARALAERRADPSLRGDDIITAALSWEIDGQPVTDEDVLSCLLLLFNAGLDTVSSQLSYIFWHLANHPADRHRVIERPEWIPTAVEEFLRVYPIVKTGRRVAKDMEFHGCPVKEGEMVSIAYAFANRDDEEFAHASEVDFERGAFRNMAFGAGVHRCLGSHLARRELAIALEEWHKLIPDYAIPESAELIEHSGNGVYGLNSLPLTWSV